jgi:hypothetical protein
MPNQYKPKAGEPWTHGVHYPLTSAYFSAIGGHSRDAGGVFPPRIQRQAARGASQIMIVRDMAWDTNIDRLSSIS